MEPALDKKHRVNWLLIVLIGISVAVHIALLAAFAGLYHPKPAPAVGIELGTIVSPGTAAAPARSGTDSHPAPAHRQSAPVSHPERKTPPPPKTIHHVARPAPKPVKAPPKEHPTVHAETDRHAKPAPRKVIKPLPKEIRPHVLQPKVSAVPNELKHSPAHATEATGSAGSSTTAKNGGQHAGARTRSHAATGLGNRTGAATSGSGSADVRERYLDTIRRMIEQKKHYPLSARQRHLEGRVQLVFTINANGQVSSVRVIQGSRFSMLDDAAVAAVRNAAPFPPPPKGMFGQSIDLKIWIAFELIR